MKALVFAVLTWIVVASAGRSTQPIAYSSDEWVVEQSFEEVNCGGRIAYVTASKKDMCAPAYVSTDYSYNFVATCEGANSFTYHYSVSDTECSSTIIETGKSTLMLVNLQNLLLKVNAKTTKRRATK